MKNLLFLLILAVGYGCGTPPKKTIRFESEPQGARVFFSTGINEDAAKGNKNFIGTTPFDWTTQVKGNGEFDNLPGAFMYSGFVQPVAVFTATLGTNSQTKVFHGGTTFAPADKAPDGVFFDFSQQLPTQQSKK